MAFDFEQETGRLNYLHEKMDDLLDGINDSYGKRLLEELISRMEKTITDFNEEVAVLTDQLKENTERKIELLKKIKNDETADSGSAEIEAGQNESKISAWERRLESLSK